MINLIILILGIALLVTYFKYTGSHTLSRRKTLITLSVLVTVFTALTMLALAGTGLAYLIIGSDFFVNLFRNLATYVQDLLDGIITIEGIIANIPIFTAAIMKFFFIVNAIFVVFGIVCLSLGFSATSNKKWTESAKANNTASEGLSWEHVQSKTCANCGTATAYTAVSCPVCKGTVFSGETEADACVSPIR